MLYVNMSTVFLFVGALATGKNLSCYQCIRTEDVECDESDLRPCPPSKDRCVIHTTKDGLNKTFLHYSSFTRLFFTMLKLFSHLFSRTKRIPDKEGMRARSVLL